MSDSGEGRWTNLAAIDEGVPAHVLTAALYERFSSRGEADFADKILSAMRKEFGGHDEKPAGWQCRLSPSATPTTAPPSTPSPASRRSRWPPVRPSLTVLPEVGLLGASLRHRGLEHLDLHGGAEAVRGGHTTGLPLLAPVGEPSRSTRPTGPPAA